MSKSNLENYVMDAFYSLGSQFGEHSVKMGNDVVSLKDFLATSEHESATLKKIAQQQFDEAKRHIAQDSAQRGYEVLGHAVAFAYRGGVDLHDYSKDIYGLTVTTNSLKDISKLAINYHLSQHLGQTYGIHYQNHISEITDWVNRYQMVTGNPSGTLYDAIGSKKDDVDTLMLTQAFNHPTIMLVETADALCSTFAISSTAKRRAFSRLGAEEKALTYAHFRRGRSWFERNFGNTEGRFNIEYGESTYCTADVRSAHSVYKIS